jgi:predicted SAM-dependent methyltransferase
LKKILNLGCGRMPLPSNPETEYVNADANPYTSEIVKLDVTVTPFPFEAETFDRIYLFHMIEHIPEGDHYKLLTEIRRILKPDGIVALSYPEFTEVARRYLEGKGDREFWKIAIYGSSENHWMMHKALMDTRYFKLTLEACGLRMIDAYPETNGQEFNTVCIAKPCEPTLTYEELMRREFANP